MRFVDEATLAATLSALPVERPRFVASGNAGPPFELLRIAADAVATFRLFMLNAPTGIPVRPGIALETPFVGAGMRDQPELHYIPARLSLVPNLFAGSRPPDVVLVHTSMPYDGSVSMGCEVNILPAAIEAVRSRGGLVVAQVNPNMPYTYGDGVLGLNEVDLALEVDRPLPNPAYGAGNATTEEIGARVSTLIPDSATLQLGIGAIPDAVVAALHDRRGLRIWSEMFSDGVLELDRTGQLDRGHQLVASFCFGSRAVYEFVHRNPQVRLLRTERTNDPAVISRNPRMVSINSALQVDLFCQANASRRPSLGRASRIYSGFGGQTDFVVGAMHSLGGQAIIALPSWHQRADVSTIVPLVDGPVTSFQQTHIVSEQGGAAVWGASQAQQARSLIDQVAHPRVREELTEEARALGLVSR
jgi:acyl-CoA hydrolase